MTRIRAAAISDIGLRRRDNQDRILCDEIMGLYGVADGVGGLPGGGEAAEEAVRSVYASMHAVSLSERPDVEAMVASANATVAAIGSQINPGLGIGTTLTFACIRAGVMILAHVGDSRCYGLLGGELVPLTEDHIVANEARRQKALGHPFEYPPEHAAALTRCIGQAASPQADITVRALNKGDRFLFCTDGVSRLVHDHEFAHSLASAAPASDIVRHLVQLAVARGGPDNATAVLAIVDEA